MPLTQGQVVHNRYRVVRLIGQGGFGAVYRAWDLSLKQPCALKENLDTTPEAQRQFEREAIILAGLRHLNLPRVTDHFLIPNQGQYLVMDFVEGQSLDQALQQNGGPFPESTAVRWIEQVCNALEYLHNQNPPIVHRDIKPQNIIITPQDQAMLVDFGISKMFDPILRTTQGARAITPGFSPPEQHGKSRTDPRSDQYALAATLYYLLTGQAPPDSLDRLIHAESYQSPHQVNGAVSLSVSDAIVKAMQLDSQDRFPTITEFLHTLKGTPAAFPIPHRDKIAPSLKAAHAMPVLSSPAVTPAAIPSLTTGARPRGVTVVAWFCILTGLGTTIFAGGLLGLIGGILMIQGKNCGRRLAMIYLLLLALASLVVGFAIAMDGYVYDAPFLVLSAIVLSISLPCLFSLNQANIKDYFLPAGAPRVTNPNTALNVIGWLHILMGFWLVIPAILGIISLSKRNKHILRILIIELVLLAIVAVIAAGYFYNEAEYYRGRYLWGDCSSCRYYSQDNFSYFASACLAFVISILPLPYLSRKDVHQAFP